MSSPRAIIQIVISGSAILGKAFAAAGKQALKNAKATPAALSSDVGGVQNATSGSLTDRLTREHRMTLDEAHLILNVKRGDPMENIMKHYEHLFKANSAPPAKKAPAKPTAGSKQAPPQPVHPHYVQSKVVRARERIEAELQASEEPATPPPTADVPGATPNNPPPPPPSS